MSSSAHYHSVSCITKYKQKTPWGLLLCLRLTPLQQGSIVVINRPRGVFILTTYSLIN